MTLKEKSLISLIVAGALFIGFLVGLSYFRDADLAIGNVDSSGELFATTTGNGAGFAGAVNTITPTATPVAGMLGSLYFSVPSGSRLQIYDATTTNVNLRTGNPASSTILIADFPAGTGTSTVALNAKFRYGLTLVWSGTVSTSTVTWRANQYK